MRTYNIEVGGTPYVIKQRAYSVEINGQRYAYRKLSGRRVLFLTLEVDLPIPEGEVMLVMGMWSMELVVNGVRVRSGKPYAPIGKVPAWAYVVCVLDLLHIVNGALGGVAAIIGILLTIRLSVSEDLAPALRLALSLVYLVASWIVLFLIAILIHAAGAAIYLS